MDDNKSFKPYVSADKVMPEFTVASIVLGIILAIVFGAANAYLGLRVGLTVSASIPAAVISMGVIRVILKKNSILENNLVQTIGSAGESLAAGAIFTMPALFLWAAEGKGSAPGLVEITLIALCGGILGILFMIPLRKALIVKEHGTLPYPEGMACAEVLLAGEEGGANASTVFTGMGFAAAFKFIVDGFKIFPSEITYAPKSYPGGAVGTQVYPALVGVGYICGPKVSSYMFAGGILGWLVIMPAIVLFGKDMILFPGTVPIGQILAEGGVSAVWTNYIKYIGAGAIAAGGFISLIKSLPLIVSTFRDAMKDLKDSKNSPKSMLRTDQDLNMGVILGGVLVVALAIWLIPAIPVNLIGALLIVVFGFFFATVSSRIVGLIGSSNNPVSGMAIATLLLATLILKSTGNTGIAGMTGAISIGSIICVIAAIAGDTSQDLKTGYILGATPKKQQIGELIGVVASAIAIGGVLYLLNSAWGYGSTELPAPQATLMKMIVEGIMDSNLPWTLVLIGVFIAIIVEILQVPVMPFAIGLYLPFQLSTCIMVGGVIRLVLDKKKTNDEAAKKRSIDNGVLYCSGMIAGEGLVGILLAIFAIIPVGGVTLGDKLDLSGTLNLGAIGSLVFFALLLYTMFPFAINKKQKKNK